MRQNYTENDLLDLQLRYQHNTTTDISDMIDTIRELQSQVYSFTNELQEIKTNLVDIYDAAHDDLVVAIDKALDRELP